MQPAATTSGASGVERSEYGTRSNGRRARDPLPPGATRAGRRLSNVRPDLRRDGTLTGDRTLGSSLRASQNVSLHVRALARAEDAAAVVAVGGWGTRGPSDLAAVPVVGEQRVRRPEPGRPDQELGGGQRGEHSVE